VQPVFDAIVESAARVCGVDDVTLMHREGNSMVMLAHFGSIPVPLNRVELPAPEFARIGVKTPGTRAILEGKTVHVHDLLEAANRFS
jgi:hypothetical protein